MQKHDKIIESEYTYSKNVYYLKFDSFLTAFSLMSSMEHFLQKLRRSSHSFLISLCKKTQENKLFLLIQNLICI